MTGLLLFFGATLLPIATDTEGVAATESAPPLVEMSGDRAVELGRKIRCPVCQGMPISE